MNAPTRVADGVAHSCARPLPCNAELHAMLRDHGVLGVVLETCSHHHLALEAIFTRDRRPHVAIVRHHVWYELKELGWSYPAIGELFARDHTTVMSGVAVFARACGLIEPRRKPQAERATARCAARLAKCEAGEQASFNSSPNLGGDECSAEAVHAERRALTFGTGSDRDGAALRPAIVPASHLMSLAV